MNPILALLLGQLSERLLVVLLLEILERVKPVVAGTSTQLDDIALEALIAPGAANARPGNGGEF